MPSRTIMIELVSAPKAQRKSKLTFSIDTEACHALNEMRAHLETQDEAWSLNASDRLVSAAIAHLYEQTIGQNVHLSARLRPMPGCFISTVSKDLVPSGPKTRPQLRLV